MIEFTRSTLPSPESYQDTEVLVIEPDGKRTRLFSDGLAWRTTLTVSGSTDPQLTASQVTATQALVSGAVKAATSRPALLTVACGNSVAAISQVQANGWYAGELVMGNIFGGSPMRFVRMTATTRSDLYGVYAYSGKRLDEINPDLEAQWFAQMVTAGIIPDMIVAIDLFANDITQDATYLQCISRFARWEAMCRRFPGVILHVLTPHPSFSYDTPSKVLVYQQVRDYLLSRDNGVDFFVSRVDTYENPAAPGTPLPGFTDSSVHPNPKGSMRNGRVIAATNARIIASARYAYRSVSANFGLIGSSAVTGSGTVTGTKPTGTSTFGYNGTQVSLAQDPGWLFTNSQSAGAASLGTQLELGFTSYAGGASTQISTHSEIEIVSGASNLRMMNQLTTLVATGNTNLNYPQNVTSDADGEFQDGDILTFRSPPLMAASGNITGMYNYIFPTFKTGGGTTILADSSVVLRVRAASFGLVVA